TFNENTPEIELINHLKDEPFTTTRYVSFEKRLLAIIKLLNGSEKFNEKKENAFIKLLATSQKGESDAILSAIEEHNGIKIIFEKFHDFWGKDNFTGVIFLLCTLLERSGIEVTSS